MTNFYIDPKSIEDDVIHIQSRSMSDPCLSDIDFKNKMAWVWTTLNLVKMDRMDQKILITKLKLVLNDPNYKNFFVKSPQMKNVKLTTLGTKDDVIMNIFAIDDFQIIGTLSSRVAPRFKIEI